MSLLGGNCVPVNILKVTAEYDSYILGSILPFLGSLTLDTFPWDSILSLFNCIFST